MKSTDYFKAADHAKRLLKAYNIFSAPVPVVEIAEGEGLSIAITSLTEFVTPEKPVCAALLKTQKVILIEKSDSPSRRRFSIAHELGHYVLHPKQLESSPELGIFFRAPIREESNPLEQE